MISQKPQIRGQKLQKTVWGEHDKKNPSLIKAGQFNSQIWFLGVYFS